jgi:hypothetical protein
MTATSTATSTEEFLPILSAGRHRNAKRGACFMEFASYLAGERWSDHPACTQQNLAALARLVNDLSSDAARSKLSVLVPSVVGLNGPSPRVATLLSVLAATHALPIASAMRQSALATGLVRAQLLLGSWSGPEVDRAQQRIRKAFDATPGAESWGREYISQVSKLGSNTIVINDEALLRTAVVGIADACVDDPDARLALLLEEAIAECTQIFAADATRREPFREHELARATA